MFVGDFGVGYHGASCHGLAWSCTRKIGKAEALVVVLHQDTQGQSDASPTCPHSSMSSYTPPCAYQPLPLARVFRVLGFLRYVSSYFRISGQPKNSVKAIMKYLLTCTYVLISPATYHLVHRWPHMANSSVSSFLTDTKQTCKNSNPPWVQDVKILRCWDAQTFRYLDARMPRYVFQTRMRCFHENSNRNSVMERWMDTHVQRFET